MAPAAQIAGTRAGDLAVAEISTGTGILTHALSQFGTTAPKARPVTRKL